MSTTDEKKKILPQTLLWRTFLLITLLLTLELIAWLQIFQYFQVPARGRAIAQVAVSIINLTRTSLINADAEKRTELLIDLAAMEGIRIYPAEPTDEIVPPQDTREMRLIMKEVRKQLGDGTRFASKWKTLDGFLISFRLSPGDKDEYWILLPANRLTPPLAAELLISGFVAISSALAVAFLIVSHISAPLRNLARSAKLIGSGTLPPALKISGPQEIAMVISAFNQMSGSLEQADTDRALIMAGISHDLRTPLARLRLSVEMTATSESERQAMVNDIEEMDRIIGQFLDFGRGKPHEMTDRIDLVQLIRDIASPYSLRDIKINLHLPEAATIKASPMPVRRAITNIIDNALHYAGNDKPLDITLDQTARQIRLKIEDRGPGIPINQVELLRRPFTRLENARSDTKGAGLGLAIVERIMKWHNGRLELLPREGGGLSAVLCFPASGLQSQAGKSG